MKIIMGDCLAVLKELPSNYVQCCVTSPPYYGLRDYGVEGQIGLEETPEAYVEKLVNVFREVKRVLKDGGTLWLNLGDSYAGSGKGQGGKGTTSEKQLTNYGSYHGNIKIDYGDCKPKDLIGIPWMVAFALRADGWWLRSDIIWHKPNPMPESVTDRPTKSHEYIFLLAKSQKYYYDAEAIREPLADSTLADGRNGTGRHTQGINGSKYFDNKSPDTAGADKPSWYRQKTFVNPESGRNKRSVWTVTTKPFKGAHFATFPPDLIEPCILAGSKPGDIVLDPFNGAGTTGLVAIKHHRDYIGIELNPEYIKLTEERLKEVQSTLIN